MLKTPKTPISYFGSKTKIASKIVKYFPKKKIFVDVFGGSGSVIFAKTKSQIEIYNDLNENLTNFFKVMQSKPDELLNLINQTLHARRTFNLAKNALKTESDALLKAYYFFICQNQSYLGLGESWSYSVTDSLQHMSHSTRKFRSAVENIKQAHKRFQSVQIEQIDFRQCIKKYDSIDTLFYIDPPKLQMTKQLSPYCMTSQDRQPLIKLITNLKGSVVISGDYKQLSDHNWQLVQLNSNKQPDCIWLSPDIKTQKNTGILKLKDDLFSNPTENLRAGAYYTHKVRTEKTEQLITETINRLKKQYTNKKITKTLVSQETGISRVNISKRYSHLFETT